MSKERQRRLFDDKPECEGRGPVWRNSDPPSSRSAAKDHERSGRAGTHRAIISEFVRENPGLTGAEIGERTGLGQFEAMRRLSDLRHSGLVEQGEPRVCKIKGTKMVTWKAKR